MNVARFADVPRVDLHRDSRMNPVHKLRKKFLIESMPDELEHLQPLSPVAYSSTGSPNEQLAIISRSESGRYTMTPTGKWSGIPVSGLSNTSVDTYVNQSSGLASFLLDDRRYHSRKYGLFYWLHPRGPDWPKISCYG
jgi:hypothetical protein